MARSETSKYLGVRISHADRIVFADAGCSKGDIASYYAKASRSMLVHAGNRPVALLRCPDGREGGCFFQKHAGKGFPREIGTVEIEEASGKPAPYMIIREPAGFVAAAQMGAIEFHIWGSRADRLEKPDRVVFDLDPDEGLSFEAVTHAALDVRKLLGRIGLDSAAMVTGGKGVHVVAPLRPAADWAMASKFARAVAERLVAEQPDRYVATMSKAKRKGKIFVDWLRNDRGNTAIAPYSIRARPGAPVAVPVSWQELPGLKEASCFDIPQAAMRLEKPCPLQQVRPDQAIAEETLELLEKSTG